MKLTWPHVAIVVAILAAMVTLTALDRDIGALLGIATLILTGIGFAIGQNQAIKEQTNGTQGALLANVAEQNRQLLLVVHELANKVAEMRPPLRVEAHIGEPAEPPEPAGE